MTDLERARHLLDDERFRRCLVNVNGYTASAVVAEYIAAARREGAEEALEEAARVCDEPARRLREELGWSAEAELLERYAAAIRALKGKP